MIRIAGISSAQGEVNERITALPTATAESPSQPVTDPNHQVSPKPLYKKFLTTQAFFPRRSWRDCRAAAGLAGLMREDRD